jgi:PKD repeat protein
MPALDGDIKQDNTLHIHEQHKTQLLWLIATQENRGDLNMVSFMRNWKSVNPRTVVMLLLFVSAFSLVSADTAITRGPAIGEIYYIGPTVTGEGIYHSTDFGETATCMDSTLNTNINFMSICADLTPGVLYGVTMGEGLYISYNHGQQNSWSLINGGMSLNLFSGVTEGFIYNGFHQHSEDYGSTFTNHSNNGFLGSFSNSAIDAEQNTGYVKSVLGDSVYIFVTYDNFENLELQNVFNCTEYPIGILTRGFYSGELYSAGGNQGELRFSSDFGETLNLKSNMLACSGFTGGRQPGELYILVNYKQMLGEIKHTYIYHSLDYGETFEVFNPFSHGPEPYYADFTATPLEGNAPLTVQFTDISSGNYLEGWQWDFQNDGVIDSYEQNPQYTYQDTGYYSVSLTIHPLQLDTATKYNFIHVTDGSGIGNDELKISIDELTNYPNPFNPTTEIRYQISDVSQMENAQVEIYNTKGQKIKTLPINSAGNVSGTSVWWNGTDQNEKPVTSGLYLFKLNTKTSPVKKMILLK